MLTTEIFLLLKQELDKRCLTDMIFEINFI
jgi:hypothetical protein